MGKIKIINGAYYTCLMTGIGKFSHFSHPYFLFSRTYCTAHFTKLHFYNFSSGHFYFMRSEPLFGPGLTWMFMISYAGYTMFLPHFFKKCRTVSFSVKDQYKTG